MTRAKPRWTPPPRIWSEYQTACRLGWSEGHFKDRLPQLEAMGFPPINRLLGGRDGDAVEMWLDAQSGMNNNMVVDDLDRRLEQYANGDGQG